MPDKRANRGAHPKDAEDFSPQALPLISAATTDLCWLLSRGYPAAGSLNLVGDRFRLRSRQRTALQRLAVSDHDRARRRERLLPIEELAGRNLLLDGYNVLVTVEVALGGGVVLGARDGTARDMASVSGSYRKVRQTMPALDAIGEVLSRYGVAQARWLLDRPISNSGRLKAILEELARERGWPWEVELSANPDRELRAATDPVATADSAILDHCGPWVNLARRVIDEKVPGVWWVEVG